MLDSPLFSAHVRERVGSVGGSSGVVFLDGLRLGRGLRNIIVEVDSKACLSTVKEELSCSKWSLFPIHCEIRVPKASFSYLRWPWVPREANQAADWVASSVKRRGVVRGLGHSTSNLPDFHSIPRRFCLVLPEIVAIMGMVVLGLSLFLSVVVFLFLGLLGS
ncbi:hypothetical protein L3X38_037453 [Prunus dulcis]|uniref:RNase H type-1 domain-containing protein n=1 Tax=Prunus dulcis TaxID=3755 RepID=A0AAD4V5B2_PRUDU|nr:hypothetical protein L3X38_037453 [Prunus dulcis]